MIGIIKWCWAPVLLAVLAQPIQKGAPTFADDIRPMLAKKCVACHSTGGMGPFNLQTYEQVRKRADLVRLVCLTGQMPPTDARSDIGQLTPHQPLSPAELLAVQDWFRLGMPEGRKTPPLSGVGRRLPYVSKHVASYLVGKGQMIPAEGRSTRTVFRVPMPPGGMSYLGGFSYQPDSPKAVRQVMLAVQKPGKPVPFTSAGVVPNTPVISWSEGFFTWGGSGGSIRTDRGDQLWMQVRAVPTGKPEPASGLLTLVRQATPARVQSKSLGNRTFVIEADSQVVLQNEWVLERDIDLLSAIPEAKFTTEQVRLVAETPDGTKETVFLVLTWDPVWPGAYNFSKPVRLKKGTRLSYEAVINNTRHGHNAEDVPPKRVTFGPNQTEELFWCHLTYIAR